MSSLSYEQAKKKVFLGFWILLIVTLIEVFFSLMGKGHIPGIAAGSKVLIWATAIIIIILSIYKAYYIVFEFMHMKYEVKGLARSVLLPTALLIWAIIAFFQEGTAWKDKREKVKEANRIEVPSGIIEPGDDIKTIE